MEPYIDDRTAGSGLAAPSFGSKSDPNSMSGRSPSRRTKLADITNTAATLAPRKRGRSGDDEPQESPNAASCIDANNHIQQLIKENSALLMLLGERNKIIELRSIEIQTLRSALQKSNQQNHHLARANCHMLAELNLCKKREKALEHELGCTGALLKAKTLELEGERLKKHKQKYGEANAKEQGSDEGVSEYNKKTQTSRNQSLSSAKSTYQVATREKNDRRRRSSQRANINLSSEPCEAVEKLLEADKVTSPTCSVIRKVLHENSPNNTDYSAPSSSSSTKHEEQKVQRGTLEAQHLELEKSSLFGRPIRKAVRRVSSYKEVPLNVKMRRPE